MTLLLDTSCGNLALLGLAALAHALFSALFSGLQSGGVLTPASALGMLLVDRLRRAGFKFDITSS